MKFTQEDLLKAMGLKIGDKVSVDDKNEDLFVGVVTSPSNGRVGIWSGDTFLSLSEIIREKFPYTVITQPKYTLTETEKHIVLAIDEKWKWIARDRDGLHIYSAMPKFDYDHQDFGCTDGYTEYFNVFIDKFGFVIENREPVSLDELREIAKEMK